MMRKILLAVALAAGVVALPATPASAAEPPCNGLPVTIPGTAGNDMINGTSGADVISTGDGDDIVFGLGGNDVVCLGNGRDVFVGGGGNDIARGGFGDDVILGDAGNDTSIAENCSVPIPIPVPTCTVLDGADIFAGGAGSDTADYSLRRNDMFLSLNDIANDGHTGENDNLRSDVENVLGGDHRDVISGNAAANNLNGGFGDDFINGSDGISGNDTVVGLIGFDRCGADSGDSVLSCEAPPL